MGAAERWNTGPEGRRQVARWGPEGRMDWVKFPSPGTAILAVGHAEGPKTGTKSLDFKGM